MYMYISDNLKIIPNKWYKTLFLPLTKFTNDCRINNSLNASLKNGG